MNQQSSDGKRILVVAGGSGGHVFPAITTAEVIRKRYPDCKLYFATDHRCEKLVQSHTTRFGACILKAPCVRIDSHHKNIFTPFHFASQIFQSLYLLLRYRPQFVVGFGGYVSVPLLLGAKILCIPCISHEQNAKIGRANQLLRAMKIKIAFTFKPEDKRSFWAGYPFRSELVKREGRSSKEALGLDKDKHVLLLMGGSQGSNAINRLGESLERVLAVLNNWQILHLTGGSDQTIRTTVENYFKIPFYDNMSLIYSASDYIISRAGSGALHEIVAYDRHAIILPYPHAEDHQRKNAQTTIDGALDQKIQIVNESEVNIKYVLDCLQQIERNHSIIEEKNFELSNRNMRLDGAKRMLDEIEVSIGK